MRKVGQWDADEDAALATAVAVHGDAYWERLSALVPGRSGKQCRERWFHHLRPGTNKRPFSPNEDALLLSAVGKYGHQWQRIAREVIPDRTDVNLKNRYHMLTKQPPKRVWNADAKAYRDACAASTVLTVQDLNQLARGEPLVRPFPRRRPEAPIIKHHDQLPPPATTSRTWQTSLCGSPTGITVNFNNYINYNRVSPFEAINKALRRFPDARTFAYDGLPRQYDSFDVDGMLNMDDTYNDDTADDASASVVCVQ